jgi:hypothetical protein
MPRQHSFLMRHPRKGTVAILVTISLTALMGIAAIALDAGLLMDNRWKTQAAADAAALAAATNLWQNYSTDQGLDPFHYAQASALTTAASNGFDNDGVTSTVTVNIPPLSGENIGKPGFAEVIIQYNQQRAFSSIFGSGDLPVLARAVASGVPGKIGLLIMDHTISDSGEIDGNVNILNGGQIFVNSSANGACVVANTSTLVCGGINIIGTLSNSGSITYTNNGGLQYYTNPIPDPLASIPEPTTAGLTNYGSVTITKDTTLAPGIYQNITIGSSGGGKKGSGGGPGPAVTLLPGIYYLASGGSLNLDSGSLSGTGVMIYNATNADKVLHPAYGPVDLTPPTPKSGGTWPDGTTSATYNGISMFLPRSRTSEVHIESTYNLNMPGTWYAHAGEWDIRPDGATTVFNIGNYICDQAEWGQGYSSSGKSNGIININPPTAAPTQRPGLVE